ncbi:hypothetical protein, partial [Paractinoplanes hotanensis]
KVLRADQGIAVSPSLWSGAAATAGRDVTRTVVSMAEILGLEYDAAQQRGRQLDVSLGWYPADRLAG